MSAQTIDISRFRDPARGPFEPQTPRGSRRDMSPPPPPPKAERLQPLCLSCGEGIAVHDGLCLSCSPPIRVSEFVSLGNGRRLA